MSSLFKSLFMGGFESSTMVRVDGCRNDLVAATRHDVFGRHDYERLLGVGIAAARDGTAWHLIEHRPGVFDFSSVLPRVRAARDLGIAVIWDLCHFGWPDHVDPLASDFPERLAAFARAFARVLRDETDQVGWFAPINEITFLSWAGGEVAALNPFLRGRGDELKGRFVRGAVAASHAVRDVDPRARLCHLDPLIHVVAHPDHRETWLHAPQHNEAQFEALDMLAGRRAPELGGSHDILDVVGVNFYDQNEWVDMGRRIHRGDPRYRPLRHLLADVHARYGRPLIIGETGTESDGRAPWLRYVGEEVGAARAAGVPVEGVCIYPILDHPGWEDERHVPVGLWGYADDEGERPEHDPSIAELRRQQAALEDPTRGVATTAVVARRPLAICLATDSREPSGMGQQMLTIGRGLAAAGNRVAIAIPDTERVGWFLAAIAAAGLEVWPIAEGDEAAEAADFQRRLEGTPMDVVDVHSGIGWEGHGLIRAARKAGVGRVGRTEHLPYLIELNEDHEAYRSLVQDVDSFTAVSAGVAASLVEAGVPAAMVHTVRNGIRPQRAVTDAEAARQREALGVPDGVPLVVSVGRLAHQKGYDGFIDAIPRILEAMPQTRFVWVGTGRLGQSLRGRLVASGLDRKVTLLPEVADVPALLAAADLVALPSLFEGLPLVALEAMAAGTPVIGTRVCGIDEAVIDGETGLLVPLGSPDALADAILELLRSPELARRLGANGRRVQAERFTADRMVREIEAAYREPFARREQVRHEGHTKRRALHQWNGTTPAGPFVLTATEELVASEPMTTHAALGGTAPLTATEPLASLHAGPTADSTPAAPMAATVVARIVASRRPK